MTFHIGLDVHIARTYGTTTKYENNTLNYWSNQVPEKGDYIQYWSAQHDQEVTLTVARRTWVLTGNTGGPRGEYDVLICAGAEIVGDK